MIRTEQKFCVWVTFIGRLYVYTYNSTLQNSKKSLYNIGIFVSFVQRVDFQRITKEQKYFAQKFLYLLSTCKRYVFVPLSLFAIYIYIATTNRAKDIKKPPFLMNDGFGNLTKDFYTLSSLVLLGNYFLCRSIGILHVVRFYSLCRHRHTTITAGEY